MTGWQVAIQEDMLPGPRLEDRFAQASDLGLQGIEFWSEGLPEQAAEIERLSGRGAVAASSINNGRRSRLLDTDPDERAHAMAELSEAIDIAARIGAEGVVFVPHFFDPLLPDISPYKTAVELELALLSAQLEILAEAADLAKVQLFVEAVNAKETHLLNRLDQASSLVDPLMHNRLKLWPISFTWHMRNLTARQPSWRIESTSATSTLQTATVRCPVRGDRFQAYPYCPKGNSIRRLAGFGMWVPRTESTPGRSVSSGAA